MNWLFYVSVRGDIWLMGARELKIYKRSNDWIGDYVVQAKDQYTQA